MIVLTLLCVIASAWAVPTESTLNVYAFPPKYPQLGPFGNLGASLTNRQITSRDVFERPVIILSEGENQGDRKLSAYYAKHGLGSVSSNGTYKALYRFFHQHSTLLGLAFTTDGFPIMPVFFQSYVENLTFPDNFRVEDLVEFADQDLLILYIASEKEFKQCGFPKIVKIGSFSINEQSIIPVSYASNSYYPPKFLPFYFVSPYFTYTHNFQKPVFSFQFHKPSISAPKPPKKVDNKIGNLETVEPTENSPSANDATDSPNDSSIPISRRPN